jgi:sec-independent protein translocase protein TatB
MFNIGPPELIVILLVALLIVGPKRLPEVGKSVGRALREIRRQTDEVRSSFELNLDDEDEDHDQDEPVRDVTEGEPMAPVEGDDDQGWDAAAWDHTEPGEAPDGVAGDHTEQGEPPSGLVDDPTAATAESPPSPAADGPAEPEGGEAAGRRAPSGEAAGGDGGGVSDAG